MKELGNNTKKANQTTDQTPVNINENDQLILLEGVESHIKQKT